MLLRLFKSKMSDNWLAVRWKVEEAEKKDLVRLIIRSAVNDETSALWL